MPKANPENQAAPVPPPDPVIHPLANRVDLAIGILAWAMFVVAVLLFFKIAWVTEDAYIIHRSVEQLFAGHGPRWNPHERVQVFTSPLWYGWLALFRVFSTNVFVNSIVASFVLFIPFLLLVRRTLRDPTKWLLAMAVMGCSVGFFDYTTSGLENVLAYALIAAFLLAYHRLFAPGGGDESSPSMTEAGSGGTPSSTTTRPALVWSLVVAGLVAFCRLDLVTLVAPPAAWAFWRNRHALSRRCWVLVMLLSATPIIVWTLFSLFYYGAPVPNTAYAKLGTGVPRMDLIVQGFHYLQVGLRRDLITVVVLIIGTGYLASDRAGWRRALALGILLNLFYVIWIGGDFMLGRFLSFGFLIALMSGLHALEFGDARLAIVTRRVGTVSAGTAVMRQFGTLATRHVVGFGALMVCAGYAFLYPHTPVNSPRVYHGPVNHPFGVADERGAYARGALVHYLERRPHVFPDHHWATEGFADHRSGKEYEERIAVGYYGYWAGTDIKIVDPLGITDPLLAHLPIDRRVPWRAGHFHRLIPEGYPESVRYDTNEIFDNGLREYYRHLKVATESPLFAPGRFSTIWKLNTGGYDDLLEHARDKLRRGVD